MTDLKVEREKDAAGTQGKWERALMRAKRGTKYGKNKKKLKRKTEREAEAERSRSKKEREREEGKMCVYKGERKMREERSREEKEHERGGNGLQRPRRPFTWIPVFPLVLEWNREPWSRSHLDAWSILADPISPRLHVQPLCRVDPPRDTMYYTLGVHA